MEGLAREFVRRRKALEKAGSGFRVPDGLRELAVRFGRWAVESGQSLGSAAEELSVSRATLERWLAEQEATPSPSLVREVVLLDCEEADPSAQSSQLRLVTPDGFRIEGLGLVELVELLRSLR